MECGLKEEILDNGELVCCAANSPDPVVIKDEKIDKAEDLSFEQYVSNLEPIISVDINISDRLNVSSQDECETFLPGIPGIEDSNQSQVFKTSTELTEAQHLSTGECQNVPSTGETEAVNEEVDGELIDIADQELTRELSKRVAFKLSNIGPRKKLHEPANVNSDQLMKKDNKQITSSIHKRIKPENIEKGTANQKCYTLDHTKSHSNVNQVEEQSFCGQVNPPKNQSKKQKGENTEHERTQDREQLKRTYNQHIILKPNSKVAIEKKRMKLLIEEIESTDTKEQDQSTSVSTVSSTTEDHKKIFKKHDQSNMPTEKKLRPEVKYTPRHKSQSTKEIIKAKEKLKNDLLAQSLTELFYPQVIIGPNSVKQISPPDNMSSIESIKVTCSKSISSKSRQSGPSVNERTFVLEKVGQQQTDLHISSQRAETTSTCTKHSVEIVSPTVAKKSVKTIHEKNSKTQNQAESFCTPVKQTTSCDTSFNKLEVTSKRIAEKIKCNVSQRKMILIDLPSSHESAEISSESKIQTPIAVSETSIQSSKKSPATTVRVIEKRKDNNTQKKIKLDDPSVPNESVCPGRLSLGDVDKQFSINLSLEEVKWIIESIDFPTPKETVEILSTSMEQTPPRKLKRRDKSSNPTTMVTHVAEKTKLHFSQVKRKLIDLPVTKEAASLEVLSDNNVHKQFSIKLSLEEMKWIIQLFELSTSIETEKKSSTSVEQTPTTLEKSIKSLKKTAIMSKQPKENIKCNSSIESPMVKVAETSKESCHVDIFDTKIGINLSPLKITPQITAEMVDVTAQRNKMNVSTSRQSKTHLNKENETFNEPSKNVNKKKKYITSKKSVSNSKRKQRKQAKGISYETFFNESLPEKWRGLVVARKSGASAGKLEVYIYSPEGKRLRSRVELTNYLQKMNITDLKPDDFNFSIVRGKKLNTKSSTTVHKLKEKMKRKAFVQKCIKKFGEQEVSKYDATRLKSSTSVDTSPQSKKKDVGKLKVSFKFSPKSNKLHKHDESPTSKKNSYDKQKHDEEKIKKIYKISQDKFYKEILQGKRISIPLVKCDDLVANFNSETNNMGNTPLASHNLKGEPTPAAIPEEAVPKLSDVPQPESANLNSDNSKGNIQQPTSHPKVWVPPKSPYGIIYESLYQDVWKLLIATIIIENASASNGNAMVWKLFERYPTLDSVKAVSYSDLNDFFKVLDNPERCTNKIKAFVEEIETKASVRPSELESIDKYGNDAYKLFCTGEWREVRPTDMDLHLYHCWLAQNSAKLGV